MSSSTDRLAALIARSESLASSASYTTQHPNDPRLPHPAEPRDAIDQNALFSGRNGATAVSSIASSRSNSTPMSPLSDLSTSNLDDSTTTNTSDVSLDVPSTRVSQEHSSMEFSRQQQQQQQQQQDLPPRDEFQQRAEGKAVKAWTVLNELLSRNRYAPVFQQASFQNDNNTVTFSRAAYAKTLQVLLDVMEEYECRGEIVQKTLDNRQRDQFEKTTERMHQQQLHEYKTTIAKLRGKIMDLEASHSVLQEETRKLQSKSLPAKETTVRRLKQELRQIKHQHTLDQQEIQDLHVQLARVEQENRDLSLSTKSIQQKHQHGKSTRQDKVSSLERELLKSRSDLRATEETITKLQTELQHQMTRQQAKERHAQVVFEKLLHRKQSTSPNKRQTQTDKQVLDVIEMFNAREERVAAEVAFLRKETENLTQELNARRGDASRSGLRRNLNASRRRRQGVTEDQYNLDSSMEAGDGSETVSAYSASEMNTDTAHEQVLEHKLNSQNKQIQSLKEKVREFALRGQSLAKALQDSERAMASEQAQSNHLRQQVANLQEEVESRPSVNDWRKQKQSIAELKRQVAEAESVNELRQGLNSRELIQRDKLDYRLGTDKIRELPREVAYDILQDICRTLEVKHVSLIVPSIKRMEKVVTMFPRIRAFLKDVCNTVLGSGSSSQNGTGALNSEAVDQVIPTLHKWQHVMRKVGEYDRLYREVCQVLATRSSVGKGVGLKSQSGGDTKTSAAAPEFHPRNIALIVQELHELVGSEDELNVHKESGLIPVALGGRDVSGDTGNGTDNNKDQTDLAFARRFISHFQRLFQVKTIPGIFPKLNEVYVFSEEAHNAFVRVREMMELPKNCTVETIMRDLSKAMAARYAVALGEQAALPSNSSHATSVQKETQGIIDTVTGGSDSSQQQLQQQQQDAKTLSATGSVSWLISETNTPNQAKTTRVNAMNAKTVNYLKRVLECTDVKDMEPLIRKLQTRVKLYDDIFPGIDRLVNSLYALLSINKLEEILPKVQQLVAAHQAAQINASNQQAEVKQLSVNEHAKQKIQEIDSMLGGSESST